MEISLRYIYLKLESMLPFLFAMFYFVGDTANEATGMMPIKDKISILTGICISIFYITKAYKNYFLKDKISELEESIATLRKEVSELKSEQEKLKKSRTVSASCRTR